MYESAMRYRLCLEEDSEEDELHVFEKCSVFHNTSSESDLYIEHVYGTLKQQMAAINHFLNVIRRQDIYLILCRKVDLFGLELHFDPILTTSV